MKKRFFSFVLALCLIVPCIAMMTACGNNPSDGPINLVGKELVIQCGDESMDWSEFTFTASYYDDGDTYFLSLTAEEAINETECFNGLELAKAFSGSQNITSVSDAKTAIEAKIKALVLEEIPKLKFHSEEKTVAAHNHSDDSLRKVYAYDVERDSYGNDLYTFKNEQDETVGELQVRGNEISPVGTIAQGIIFYWNSEPELDYNLLITLPKAGGTAEEGSKVTTFDNINTNAHFSFVYSNYKYVIAE